MGSWKSWPAITVIEVTTAGREVVLLADDNTGVPTVLRLDAGMVKLGEPESADEPNKADEPRLEDAKLAVAD